MAIPLCLGKCPVWGLSQIGITTIKCGCTRRWIPRTLMNGLGWMGGECVHVDLSVYSLEQHASFQAFEAVWFRCSFSQDTALRELSSDIWPLKMRSLRGHETLSNRQTPSDGAQCPRRTETSTFSMYWLHTDLARPSWIKQRSFTIKVTPYWAVLIFDLLYRVLTMLRCHLADCTLAMLCCHLSLYFKQCYVAISVSTFNNATLPSQIVL